MDWHAATVRAKHVGGHRTLILLVLIAGPVLGLPLHSNPIDSENAEHVTESSASTVEVLRNMQKLLGLTKLLGTKMKFAKQAETGAEAEGAANALAYLTDSFGGQLAGQILSVILSSVTGDVRGILGNSLNLFQTDDTRDRVQFFLDELSQNFLKITGLGALTTTKPPLQQSTSIPGIPANAQALQILGPGSGQNQYNRYQAAQTIAFKPLQSGSTLIQPGIPSGPPSSSSGISSLQQSQQNLNALQQQQQQQQPIIYVLPNLNGGTSSGSSTGTSSGTTGSKTTTGSKVTTSNSGDDDSEEDRKLWSKNIPID